VTDCQVRVEVFVAVALLDDGGPRPRVVVHVADSEADLKRRLPASLGAVVHRRQVAVPMPRETT